MKSGLRRLQWVVLLSVVLISLAAALAVQAVRAQVETAGWVAHTHEVITRLENVMTGIVTAETSQRGYLLAGDESQLAFLEVAGRQVEADLQALARLTSDNPVQRERLPGLRAAATERLQALATAASLRRQGDLEGALVLVRGRGRALMGDVRARVDAMREEEERLLDARLRTAERASRWGVAATAGTGALALVLVVSLYAASSRHLARLREEQLALQRSRGETLRKAGELHRANELLQQSAAELERRVEERTAALADANAELEGFARTVAHDLRAPLRNIQGFATALLEDEAPRMSADGSDYARRLVAGALRLDGMISDLLEYSRLARTQLACEPVELGPLVAQLLRELEPDIGRSGASVTIPPSLPCVLAHRTTLLQVLTNLMTNALKFVSPEVTPRVEIGVRCQDGIVALSVADNGIGIDPAHHERIFSVFERLHGQERYPGSGIGLAIVRKGVERMGGRVRLDSRAGAGSRFTLELPLADRRESGA